MTRRPDYSSAVIGTGFGLGRWLLSRWTILLAIWIFIVLLFHFPVIMITIVGGLLAAHYFTSADYKVRRDRRRAANPRPRPRESATSSRWSG